MKDVQITPESFELKKLEANANCLMESSQRDDWSGIANSVRDELPDYLIEWNNTNAPYSNDVCMHSLFEVQVRLSPNSLAVVFEECSVTYQSLNEKANQLAHYLIHNGVVADSLIGVLLERSIEMVVALLAILKAGGAYVPLDPDYPDSRIKLLVKDAALKLVLTTSKHKQKIKDLECNILCLDETNTLTDVASHIRHNPKSVLTGLSASNLAYVLYTSGSTGMPKGVMVEHRALVNRIEWMKRKYGCDSSDCILQKTPFSFDVSIWEFFLPLISGARLVLARPGGHRDPVYLFNLIQNENVTKLHFVPSMLNGMLAAVKLADCKSLRQVFCSGEALLPASVASFFDQDIRAELHNLYGPTEAAIDVSYWSCSAADAMLDNIPIGRPIDNIKLFILNESLRPAVIGELGELHIGGDGLARGYLNRPNLTDEKFIYNQLAFDSCNRLYKTGDLCRYRADGNIEFCGRIDHQVKIRGYRIELGEIENLIVKFGCISDAVVLSKGEAGSNQLVAFLVCHSDIEEAELRKYLNALLPDYMVPSWFIVLSELPLTPNGKVDRKALCSQELNYANSCGESSAEMTFLQRSVYEVWINILGYTDFCIDDDLFKIGGDSIAAIQIFSAINNKFGVDIYMEELFSSEHFSIRWLVDLIEKYQIKSLGEDEYSALLKHIEGLSEEEVQELLSENSMHASL